MNTISRKQREYMERERLIMETARDMLATQGYQGFSMERIADAIEYSKGTVYKHFSSKEDVLTALCCDSMQSLLEFFHRATHYQGNSRERITALILGYALHAQLRPIDIQNMQVIKTQVVRDKISEHHQQRLLELELAVADAGIRIARDAIKAGDLPDTVDNTPGSIIMGLWTMGYGTMLLQRADIAYIEIGLELPANQFLENAQKLLDGYQWQPLSHEFNIQALYQRIENELFAEEIKQLNH